MAKHAFNLPNILTYGRILAVPLVVLCFFLEGRLQSSDVARWLALAIFIAASVTDFLDGYLARVWHQQSTIGRMLDPIADKLLVVDRLLLLASDNRLGDWSLWAAIIILSARWWSPASANSSRSSGQRAGDAARQVEDHDADGGDRVPDRRSGRRQDRPAMRPISGIGLSVDFGAGHALYRLRLFPRRR